jgi:hypothetical protein
MWIFIYIIGLKNINVIIILFDKLNTYFLTSSECFFLILGNNTGYFTSDNETDVITNATHNTFSKKAGYFNLENVLWVAFAITSGSLSHLNYPVFMKTTQKS